MNAQTLQPDTSFVKNLQATMRTVEPTAPQYHGTQQFLQTYPQRGYVYVRHDSHRQPFNDHMMAHTKSSSAEINTSHWMSMARNRTFPLIA